MAPTASPVAGSEGEPATPEIEPAALPPFEWRAVLLIAGAFVALELAVASRYGIHRDELYFLACARHLAWGYVDQPPLVPAIAWVVNATVGASAVGLRVLPALAGGGAVLVTAQMARELGGRRAAQVIAALAAATSPQLLAMFHLLSTAAFDSFFWSIISWLTLRLCRTGDRRLLVAMGAVTGVAVMNKLNVAILVAAIGICLAAGRRRKLLLNRYAGAGAGVAVLLFLPDLYWNVTHHWAQLTMLQNLHQENSTLGSSLVFVPAQLIVVGPVLAFLWVGGLFRMLRHPVGRTLGLAYLVMLVFFVLTGGKPYYLAGAYFALFAGGGLLAEERLAMRSGRRSRRLRGWVKLEILGALVVLPLALPVLPASTLPSGPAEGQINKDLSATLGWRAFAQQIGDVAGRLPASERSRLVVYTGDYGAAGAIDLYGPQFHLPGAISGHNNYWWWGPGRSPNHSTTIAVNLPRSYLDGLFRTVVRVGAVRTPGGAWTEERGDPIFVCTGQRETWARAWPAARHYG